MKKQLLNIVLVTVILIASLTRLHAQNSNLVCPTFVITGTAVSCNGGNNGQASISGIQNASSNYSITWTSSTAGFASSNSNSISSLQPGTYTATVRNNTSGCQTAASYVVTEPDPITIFNEVVTDVKCFGMATGSIVTANSGGNTGSKSYEWLRLPANSVVPNSTPATNLMNATAGVYKYTITDNKGCKGTKTFEIKQPNAPLQKSEIITNAKCYGNATGAIDLTVWGGTQPYYYQWSNGVSSQDISQVVAGNYNVTVTDLNGCVLGPISYAVSQAPQLAGGISPTNVLCNGDLTGAVSASITGGTQPYHYSWQNSQTLFAANSASISQLPADNYQLTLTDKNNCKLVLNQVVTEPSALALTHTYKNISCYGYNDGEITIVPSGGTPAYSYHWANGAGATVGVTQNLSLLYAELYTLTLTDANGCIISLTQELTQPELPVTVNETVVDVLCHGNNTGVITLDVIGGTAPYNYVWSNNGSTAIIDNLFADTYNYTVVDANNCQESGIVVVSQPVQPLTVTNQLTHVNCFGESNGIVDLTITGGTAPYVQYWTNSNYVLSEVGEDLVNFPAEIYTYLITDAHNCTETNSLTITEPPLLTSTISGVNILCHGGNNGSIDLDVAGGVLPYSYVWNNNIVTQDQSDLYAGDYSVTVLDAHNCLITNGITLTEPLDSLTYTFEIFDVKCNDGQDGSIIIEVAGGTFPYFYTWSNGDTQAEIENLVSATYEFVVTDNNGCLLSDSLFVNQPDPLLLNEVIQPVTCFGFSDGEIDITPTGGTQPYNYKWFNSTYVLSLQEEDLLGWPADVYQLEVIDSNNCFYERFLTISQPDVIEISHTSNKVSCFDGSDGNIFVSIIGGNPGYYTNWSNGATTQNLLNIPAGNYTLQVVDQKNCKDSIKVEIIQPLPISVSFEVTKVSCIDQLDGSAYALAAGGNGGYSLSWSNGDNGSTAGPLLNQYYAVNVVDVLGCTGSDSVFIPKDSNGCIDPVTAFSPNGDNYNDTWIIDNMYLYPELHLQVMNKWGNVVYDRKGSYIPWDGTQNGEDLPADVYYYILNLNHPDRKPLIGNISIVR